MTFHQAFNLASYMSHKAKHKTKSPNKQDTTRGGGGGVVNQPNVKSVRGRRAEVELPLSTLTASCVRAVDDLCYVQRSVGQSLGGQLSHVVRCGRVVESRRGGCRISPLVSGCHQPWVRLLASLVPGIISPWFFQALLTLLVISSWYLQPVLVSAMTGLGYNTLGC